ncbi:MAG TPA: rod shape-determining protein MreD [Stellaceae bacterium]|jgi:rod shape-determining protein MreD|nr:rod shape-determining protein MreD [Stellaceae bacterium]
MPVTPAAPSQGLVPKLIPIISTSGLAMLEAVPVALPDYAVIAPDLVLMSTFHWCIYRPGHMPYLALFGIGLFVDFITAGPVGLTSLVLLLLRWTVLKRRRDFVGRAFPFIWGGFTIAAGAANALRWGIGSVLAWQVLDPRGFVFQTALTVACYPIMTLLFARVQRALMS